MSEQKQENNLFADLSDRQQESISGGGQLLNLAQFDNISFENQVFGENKILTANANGAQITKTVMNDFTASQATSDLFAEFAPSLDAE